MREEELAHEREQVEWIFGLTGGELSDAPWRVVYESESDVDATTFTPEGERVPEHELYCSTWRYWCEDAPSYVTEREEPELHPEWPATCRTVVTCAIHGGVRRVFFDAEDGKKWELLKYFTSSGEAPCPVPENHPSKVRRSEAKLQPPNQYRDRPKQRRAECVMCGERIGEEHGYLYLGDGWVEAVYVCRNFWEET